jgi:hypothetical protein
MIWIPDGIPLREWLEFYQDIDVAMLQTHLVLLDHCQMYPSSMIWARRIPVSSEYSMRLLRDPWHPISGWLMQCSFDSHYWVIASWGLLIYQKSLDFRLDSGSSWLDGVNGILMQQEPNSLKQDYWNRRAIASLANTLFTVVEPIPMPLLSSMLLLQL